MKNLKLNKMELQEEENIILRCEKDLPKMLMVDGLYTELNEIVPRETQFHRELSSLLNRYSKENGSNTPDFLLASYLNGCLHTFNSIVSAREEWYGRREKRKEKDITGETQIGEQM